MTTTRTMQYPERSNLFRPIDVAVANDVATLKYEGKYVPTVLSTPRRALSVLMKVLKIKNHANIPLPYVSVQRLIPELDQMRYARVFHRKVEYSDDRNAVSQLRRATPFNVNYQITVWDKKRYSLQEVAENYLSRYWPMYKIDVNYGPPYHSVPCHASIVTTDDLSDLEPGEDADRMLKHQIQMLIEGWAFEDTFNVPTVRKEIVCFIEERADGTIQTLESLEYSE